jgi:hypothetical protein
MGGGAKRRPETVRGLPPSGPRLPLPLRGAGGVPSRAQTTRASHPCGPSWLASVVLWYNLY